jgi:hypothetical protein
VLVNSQRKSDELWEECTDWLSHTMPYVMERGKVSYAIQKRCSSVKDTQQNWCIKSKMKGHEW